MEEIGRIGNTAKPENVDAMSSGKLTRIKSRLFDLHALCTYYEQRLWATIFTTNQIFEKIKQQD